MSQLYVGTTLISDHAVLKQAALLFDKVMLPPDWGTFAEVRHTLHSIGALDSSLDRMFRPVPVDPLPESVLTPTELRQLALTSAIGSQDEASRRWAIRVQQEQPDNVVLPLVHSSSWRVLTERKQRVVRLVLNELPLPDETTPWQAIADWRADEEARQRYRRLRLWISQMSRSDLPESEIAEGLATQLDDYASYMKLRHQLLKRSRAEVVLTTVAGILDDLARVRLSSAVEKMFSLLREEASLLAAELDAPGRQIAYVASTNERFRR